MNNSEKTCSSINFQSSRFFKNPKILYMNFDQNMKKTKVTTLVEKSTENVLHLLKSARSRFFGKKLTHFRYKNHGSSGDFWPKFGRGGACVINIQRLSKGPFISDFTMKTRFMTPSSPYCDFFPLFTDPTLHHPPLEVTFCHYFEVPNIYNFCYSICTTYF